MSGVAEADNLASFQEARFEPYFAYLLLFVHDSLPRTHNWMWREWCCFEFHIDSCVGYRRQWINAGHYTNYEPYAYTYTYSNAVTEPDAYANSYSHSHSNSDPNACESNDDADGRDIGEHQCCDYVWDAAQRQYGNFKRKQSRYANASLSGRNYENLRAFHGLVRSVEPHGRGIYLERSSSGEASSERRDQPGYLRVH